MSSPDLNLLVTLDVLLAEGSVAGAARRLRLSPSAMSRALARLREATGDPLLVRAGRGLVPTPRAIALRERIGPLVQEARAALGPAERLDLGRLERTFTFRTREGFVENFGGPLLARIESEAPGVRLSFLAKGDRDSQSLREGEADLETGVVGAMTGPEVRARALFRDRFVAVVRPGHSLAGAAVTAAAYAGARHVAVSPTRLAHGPVDDALAALGLQREVATIVGGFAAALALARACDLVATVPERHTGKLRDGLVTFPLPFATPEIPICLMWHPRLDADPAHRWLRGCVKEVVDALHGGET
ncbi:MAG TPA: LysR family transcriptional regulator [Allosphingosinicella sp.]|nr:LysR family transcriptional regulator [Allosphingosinicella sp.]